MSQSQALPKRLWLLAPAASAAASPFLTPDAACFARPLLCDVNISVAALLASSLCPPLCEAKGEGEGEGEGEGDDGCEEGGGWAAAEAEELGELFSSCIPYLLPLSPP